MLRSFISRWPFLAAVALVSAAASDVAVETIANSGAFGARYYDSNDSSIIPSLIAATLLALSVIALHARALVGRSRGARRDWLIDAARNVARRMPVRDFPAILTMQFVALFAMENAERLFAGMPATDGCTWLGGPVPITLAIHITIGAIGTFAAGRLMRSCAAHVVSLVCHALEFVLCARNRASTSAFVVRRAAAEFQRDGSARSRHIRGRAPPLFLALA